MPPRVAPAPASDPSSDAAAATPSSSAAAAPLSYDAALDAVGTGAFTTRMTLLMGLGNAADAVELLSVSLILPAVGPDGRGALRLSVPQLAQLSAALFWGALVGTLAAGVLSDGMGRRRALTAAMAVAGVFGLLSAAATSYGGLLFCRVLCGVGVGGSIPVVFGFLAEVLPTAARGRHMCALVRADTTRTMMRAFLRCVC
jgi:MFS family permease